MFMEFLLAYFPLLNLNLNLVNKIYIYIYLKRMNAK